MNILFFNDTLDVGGGETWVISVAEKLRGRGHNVYVCCPTGSWFEKAAKRAGIEYLTHFIRPEFTSLLIWTAVEFVVKKRIDIIYCTIIGHRKEAPLLAAILREAGRGIAILKIGMPIVLTKEHYGFGYEYIIKKVTVVCSYIKEIILERFNELDPDYIKVCYEGVDLSLFDLSKYTKEDRMRIRNELSISTDDTLIVAIGRLTYLKSFDLLLYATRDVLKENSKITVAIVGQGKEEKNLKALAKKLRIDSRVVFTGFRSDVADILNSADLLVHPSALEGIPNVIMEAMAMAKPVVAVNACGMPELVVDGETGLLVQPDSKESLTEAILKLIRDKGKMEEMGKKGYHRVKQHFDRDKKVSEMEQFLQEELDKSQQQERVLKIMSPRGLRDLGIPTEAPEHFFPRQCRAHLLRRKSTHLSVLDGGMSQWHRLCNPWEKMPWDSWAEEFILSRVLPQQACRAPDSERTESQRASEKNHG